MFDSLKTYRLIEREIRASELSSSGSQVGFSLHQVCSSCRFTWMWLLSDVSCLWLWNDNLRNRRETIHRLQQSYLKWN